MSKEAINRVLVSAFFLLPLLSPSLGCKETLLPIQESRNTPPLPSPPQIKRQSIDPLEACQEVLWYFQTDAGSNPDQEVQFILEGQLPEGFTFINSNNGAAVIKGHTYSEGVIEFTLLLYRGIELIDSADYRIEVKKPAEQPIFWAPLVGKLGNDLHRSFYTHDACRPYGQQYIKLSGDYDYETKPSRIAFSPQHNYVAFIEEGERAGFPELYYRSLGEELGPVTRIHGDATGLSRGITEIEWSPDGKKLLYYGALEPGPNRFFVADFSQGTPPTTIELAGYPQGHLARWKELGAHWSGDSRYIKVELSPAAPKTWKLYVFDLESDTPAKSKLVSTQPFAEGSEVKEAYFSQENDGIVYKVKPATHTNHDEIYFVDISTSSASTPISLITPSSQGGPFRISEIKLSPVGGLIAFEGTYQEQWTASKVFVVDQKGVQLEISHPEAIKTYRPRWSYDGKYLGFIADRSLRSGELNYIEVSSGQLGTPVYLGDIKEVVDFDFSTSIPSLILIGESHRKLARYTWNDESQFEVVEDRSAQAGHIFTEIDWNPSGDHAVVVTALGDGYEDYIVLGRKGPFSLGKPHALIPDPYFGRANYHWGPFPLSIAYSWSEDPTPRRLRYSSEKDLWYGPFGPELQKGTEGLKVALPGRFN